MKTISKPGAKSSREYIKADNKDKNDSTKDNNDSTKDNIDPTI